MANPSENILNYRVIGKGHPVVFLHGFMLSSELWKNMIPYVPKGFQIILIDLPGHGKSKDIPSPDSLEDIAKLVQKTIASIVTSKFSIVGHSLGGYVALALKEMGCDIQKCVLLNSNFWEDTEEKKIERNRICKVVKLNTKILIQEAIPHLFPPSSIEKNKTVIQNSISVALKMHPKNILNTTLAMRDRLDLTNVLNENPAKFLIIQGNVDHIIPYDTMKDHIEKYKLSSVLFYLDKSGHMSIVENSKKVTFKIFDFLK